MTKISFPCIRNLETGEIAPLAETLVTIGSAAECDIRLRASGVAPRVAHLMFGGGTYRIQSLGTDTPLTVDNQPVEGTLSLEHGCVIVIGETRYMYLTREDEGIHERSRQATDGPVDKLIGVVVSLLKNRDQDLSRVLVASVSQLLKCDAARLVAQDKERDERRTIARYPQAAELARFSSRAINWAGKASRTVLMHNSDWADSQESMSSLEKNLVASVLCAPLRDGEDTLGYLYLDRLQSNDQFTEQDRAFCDALLPLFSEILAVSEETRRQQETIARLQEHKLSAKGSILYESEAMAGCMRQAEKLATPDSPLLILGETGTGKELVARFIHERSPRAEKPFLAINCGAIPENLIESELFGHEKGAFTGATQRKAGLFEAADGGSVLLDEIGELPPALQVKLLRVLQESEVTRVGSTRPEHVSVRVIAATNKDLEKECAGGRFRQDLFFRLNVLALHLPPLRDRDRDPILLAEYFVAKFCEQFGMTRKTISASSQKALLTHSWPGNIRELENAVQKAVLLSEKRTIEVADLGLGAAGSDPATPGSGTTLRDARNRAETSVITQTLAKTGGNISLASKILDIDRKWLMKKMVELDINIARYRK